jgi:RNA recognition motif-containing protein
MTKVYAANLRFTLTPAELEDVFSSHGGKNARIIFDAKTGQSRGFGFVDFDTEEEALAAINEFDGTQLEGRSLHVELARERVQR